MSRTLEQQMQLMYQQREEILQRSLTNITFSRPIVSKDGIGIIFPNTITTIQGKKGSHKSRLTEIMCARILDSGNSKEHLGMQIEQAHKPFLLYVDTERNQRDQFPYAIQNIRKKSGHNVNAELENFDFLSLTNVSRSFRFEVLKRHIEKLRESLKGYHIIIVFDVITDCIGSFNDVKQSMELIDLINELINSTNVSFITVIHENPGGEKARGHLGTEIINKSSQVIQISTAEELIKVKFLHSRSTGKIPEWNLVFDSDTKSLKPASQGIIDTVNNKKQTAAPIEDLKEYLKYLAPNTISKNELTKNITQVFKVGERTIHERLTSLEKNGDIKTTKIGRSKMITLLQKT